MAGLSAVEDIREVLRREIVERMQVGDLLPNERDLAERFGVARNTVRETMIHLEAFGLIEKTRRGAKVRKPDFDPIFSVFAQHFDNSAKTLEDVLNFRRILKPAQRLWPRLA
ncbi:GntR family transcriptional regulator [Pannonibacter sp. Pt2-lr]